MDVDDNSVKFAAMYLDHIDRPDHAETVRKLTAEVRRLRAERDAAIKECAEWAANAGRAEGRAHASNQRTKRQQAEIERANSAATELGARLAKAEAANAALVEALERCERDTRPHWQSTHACDASVKLDAIGQRIRAALAKAQEPAGTPRA